MLRREDGSPVLVGRASAAFACDWDRDGDLDLLVGNIDGEVWLVAGTGKGLAFGEPVRLLRGIPGGNAGPTVADWDGDGTPDLLVGCGDGSVRHYRASGDEGLPELAEPVQLVAAGDWGAGRGVRAKIWATDWNGDGRLDLLLGEFHSVQGIAPEVPEEERDRIERANAARTEISKEISAIYQRIHGEVQEDLGEDEEAVRLEVSQRLRASEEYMALLDRMREASTILSKYRTPSTPHGHVWLFLRKAAAAATEEE